MPQNSLTLVIDEQGVYYRIPICVINDPMNFNADYVTEQLKNKKAPTSQQISVSHHINSLNHLNQNLKLRHGIVEYKIDIQNTASIAEVKEIFV